jgi:hypothetical protein
MRKSCRVVYASLIAGAFAVAPTELPAQTAFAVTAANQLVRFDVKTPGAITRTVPISATVNGEAIVGLDFRPLTGQLYGLGSASRVYRIGTRVGEANQVGGPGATFSLSGSAFGFDFDPVTDRIRIVSDTGQNFRVNPDTGAVVAFDTPLNGAATGAAGSAYANNFSGASATTLFAIDAASNRLMVQNPPESGTLTPVGAGLGVDPTTVLGFDIRTAGKTSTAYAAMQVGGVSQMYRIDLATGAATLLGNFPAGMTITALALAPAPPVGAPDFNGDGRSDILYRNFETGQVYRMFMDGFAASGGQVVHAESDAWMIVADGDLTGDGISDLLWRNVTTGEVYLMPFDSNGHRAPGGVIYTEPDQAWEIFAAPDLDGNAYADILWVNRSTGQVYAMLMGSTGIIAQRMVHAEADLNWALVGTLGNAGRGRHNQLLWRNYATGDLYLMAVAYGPEPNFGFGCCGKVIWNERNPAWQVVGTPDLNGDGRSDLLWRNTVTGQVYGLILDNGDMVIHGMIHVEPDLAWKIVATGDYDGDGRSDILWRHETTGQLHMMRMDGLGIITQASFLREPDTTWRVMGPYEYAK